MRLPDGRATIPVMRKTRVLFANDPRSYREVLAGTTRELRPEIEVRVTAPETLDGELEALAPDLVICSRLTEAVRERVPAWIELYPDGKSLAVVSVEGQRSTFEGLDLPALLSFVDTAVELASKVR